MNFDFMRQLRNKTATTDNSESNTPPVTRNYDLGGISSGRTLCHFISLRHLLLGRREFAGGAGAFTTTKIWLIHKYGRLAVIPRRWLSRFAARLGQIARSRRH
ncbi:MAG: hypothetical protein ACOYCD_07120 [Kiritimatiellia bacterium]|jgi:hypothetical protein